MRILKVLELATWHDELGYNDITNSDISDLLVEIKDIGFTYRKAITSDDDYEDITSIKIYKAVKNSNQIELIAFRYKIIEDVIIRLNDWFNYKFSNILIDYDYVYYDKHIRSEYGVSSLPKSDLSVITINIINLNSKFYN